MHEKQLFLTRKGDGGFNWGSAGTRKGDRGFRQPAQLADRAWLRCRWAAARPGRATSVRPTLQTSSNQHDLNRLAKTSVTNVVNLSPKTSIFTEKADGLTTFVTTGQKSTRKTPWIDDVCNNTRRATRQHNRPHWCGGRRRDRRARPRCRWAAAGPGRATHRQQATPVWRAPEGPAGQAAVPVGGGRAWAGLEIDHAEPSGSRVAISRAGRRPPAHTAARPIKAGGAAPETPVGPQATTHANKRLAGGQATRRPEIWRGIATPEIRRATQQRRRPGGPPQQAVPHATAAQ